MQVVAALTFLTLLNDIRAASVLLTDGTTLDGEIAAADSGSITIGKKKINLLALDSIQWMVNADAASVEEMVVFRNGGRVSGRILSAGTATKKVKQQTSWGERTWHLPSVLRLVFDRSPTALELLSADLPVAIHPIEGRSIPGERVFVRDDLVRATSLEFGKKDLERKENSFVSLGGGGRKEFALGKPYVKVLSQNGDIFSGVMVKASDGKLTLKLPFTTFPASTIELPLNGLSRLIVLNGRAKYLSDLKPESQKNTPYLFGFTSRARPDEAFTGGPLMIGGRMFLKGLATRARTEISYLIDKKYAAFAATVGVDDGINSAGGSVKFQVYAEKVGGKPLFDSGLLPHDQKQTASVRLDVSNISRLILVTDWGPKGDIGAHGDWAGARVVRK
ncbi:MAG: NPCBM/NEW2 domain-containing protein [Planctomycetota bacterium]|nr:NPCBM/NEW2 domain-containing protein [Planctomycetota bacterium]